MIQSSSLDRAMDATESELMEMLKHGNRLEQPLVRSVMARNLISFGACRQEDVELAMDQIQGIIRPTWWMRLLDWISRR